MNEWAARIMSMIPERTNKADLEQFIQEVSNEDLERMYFQKDFNEEEECRPTFEQVSHDRIIDEANKNVIILKSLELILHERMQGFNAFSASVSKTRPYFEQFEHSDCTLKLALDSLFIYVEQEILQSKQNIFLGDLRRSLNEMRTDAQKRITDYQKEIAAVEKDVLNAEKKLAKSKEQYKQSVEFKAKMESFELDILINAGRMKKSSFVGNTSASSGKGKEIEDSVAKYDREIKEDIRNLLRIIGNRDQVLSASRRAFQKLDKECKKAIYHTLRKVAEKEKENALLHLEVMSKLESTVCAVDVDHDVDEFIQLNIAHDNSYGSGGALELSSQALSLLGDLIPTSQQQDIPQGRGNNSISEPSTPGGDSTVSAGSNSSGTAGHLSTSASANNMASPFRTKSISSGGSGNNNSHNSSSFQTPVSKLFASASDNSNANNTTNTKRVLPAASSEELASYLSQIFYTGEARPPPDEFKHHPSDSRSSADFTGVRLMEESDSTVHDEQAHSLYSQQQLAEEKQRDYDVLDNNSPIHGANRRMSKEYLNYKRKSLHVHHSLGTIDQKGGLTPSATKTAPKNTQSERESELIITSTSQAIDQKSEHRKTRILRDDLQYLDLNQNSPTNEWLQTNPDPSLVAAVDWINRAVKSQSGRDVFISELNQFRSKKVDVGAGFDALGAVLWTALSYCQSENDIHNAKVMMMLSQTFYRQIDSTPLSTPTSTPATATAVPTSTATTGSENNGDNNSTEKNEVNKDKEVDKEVEVDNEEEEEEDRTIAKRGVAHRQYIKEKLISHSIWQDGNYWEQALWQCAIEQLQTIPYEKPWYDMDRETRALSVRRVHEVIFSQVMAITHSMLELGCTSEQSREFLYRMCVIHQLGEAQRQQLLGHVLHTKV